MKVLLIGANGRLGTDVNRIFRDAIFQPGTPLSAPPITSLLIDLGQRHLEAGKVHLIPSQ